MSKRVILTAGVILVLAAATVGYVWYVRQPAAVAEVPLTVKSTRSIERSATYEFVVDLPAVDGLADPDEQREVNAAMRRPIIAVMERIRAAAGVGPPYRYESSFFVTAFSGRFLSVQSTHAEYRGAPQPTRSVTTFTYDFAKHEEVVLDDLFRVLPTEYLPILARLAKEDLLRSLGLDGSDADPRSVEWVARGAAPAAVHYETFHLTEEAIAFHFPPAAVAPSGAGVQEVAIPYRALREMIDPGSVIGGY